MHDMDTWCLFDIMAEYNVNCSLRVGQYTKRIFGDMSNVVETVALSCRIVAPYT